VTKQSLSIFGHVVWRQQTLANRNPELPKSANQKPTRKNTLQHTNGEPYKYNIHPVKKNYNKQKNLYHHFTNKAEIET